MVIFSQTTIFCKYSLFQNYRDLDTKKVWLDHAFREYQTTDIITPPDDVDLDKCDKYVELTIKATKEDLCSKTLPIQILSDLFDVITLEQCERMFGTIERNITVWKSDEFFGSVKNNILRICNGK